MFRIILISLLTMVWFSPSYAQGPIQLEPAKNVPFVVEQAFEKQFTGKEAIWYQYYRGKYDTKLRFEAKFMIDNRYAKASYDEVGFLMALAVTISPQELPAEAIAYMKQQYPTLPVADVLMVQRMDDKTYEIGTYTDGAYTIFVFNDKGTFLRSTKA